MVSKAYLRHDHMRGGYRCLGFSCRKWPYWVPCKISILCHTTPEIKLFINDFSLRSPIFIWSSNTHLSGYRITRHLHARQIWLKSVPVLLIEPFSENYGGCHPGFSKNCVIQYLARLVWFACKTSAFDWPIAHQFCRQNPSVLTDLLLHRVILKHFLQWWT